VVEGIDFHRMRREIIRWNLLRALDYARPEGTTETVLLLTIQGLYADATQREIRRELDYLEGRALLTIDGRHTGGWHACLDRNGVDLVEYAIACEPGIARPPKV
jgi:hypothetical protein